MDICTCFSHLHSLPLPLLIITLTGLLTLLRLTLFILRFLYTAFLRAPKPLLRYGSHAVITGATDGIGKAFAFQLARQRLHLILIGRSTDKLHTVTQEILTNYPNTKIQTVVIDFSQDLVSGVERLKEVISGVDVGVLVNNAGLSYPYARFFHEVDEELLMNLVKVNAEGVTRVTQAVLPGMIERKRGAVVNIGSGTAIVIPTEPLYAVYPATKAYIDQFSRCLYVEYKNMGIDVQCQVPLYVATKMSSIRRPSFFAPSADTYARSALRWIGYEPRCTPYWPHYVQWCLLSMLPESVIDNWRLNFCIGVRKRGHLKDARKKGQ